MTLKNQIIIRLSLIASIYIGMNLPIWMFLPKYTFEIVWLQWWHVTIANWRTIYYGPHPADEYISPLILGSSILGAGFIFILIFIWPRKSSSKGSYGKAVWASSALFKKMGLNYEQGIILGKFNNKLLRMKEPLSVLLLAPPGTGKTTGIVVPNVLYLDNSMVIHDPKGEIYDTTAKAVGESAQVILFDPTSPHSAKYNVFAKEVLPENTGDVDSYIMNVATILIKSEGREDFFIKEARTAFGYFAQWLIWKHGATSLPQILEKILSKNDLLEVIYEMSPSLRPQDKDDDVWSEEDDNTPEIIIRRARSFLMNAANPKQLVAVTTTLRQSMDVFMNASVCQATSSDIDFTAQTLRSRKQVVYLKVREIDKDRLAPLMAMIFGSLTRQLLSEKSAPEDRIVTFILDEFSRLGKIDAIMELPETGRGYKFNAIFIAQDYGQITKIYSQSFLSSLESNTAYKIILPQNNYQTAEMISKLIGHQTQVRSSFSKNMNTKDLMNSSRGRSISEEGVPLVSAQYITNMSPGTALVLAQNFFGSPIRVTLPYYFKDRKMKKMVSA